MKYHRCWISLVLLLPTVGARGATVFFDEDINHLEEGTTNNDTMRIAHPNADAAQAGFLAQLVGTGTEDFESFTAGANVSTVTFVGVGTATLSPALPVMNVPTGTFNGTYPISGDQFLLQATGNPNTFSIGFSTPQAAFGFYATDIEVPGNLILRFHLAGGVSTLDRPVPSAAGTGGQNPYGLCFVLRCHRYPTAVR